jgi:hypothetical protein
MSAANDGADADSRIAAVARRLIFITVPMGSTGHWYFVCSFGPPTLHRLWTASIANLTQPRFPLPCFAGQIRPGMGPKKPGNGHRGHGFPVRSPLSLRPIAGALLARRAPGTR